MLACVFGLSSIIHFVRLLYPICFLLWSSRRLVSLLSVFGVFRSVIGISSSIFLSCYSMINKGVSHSFIHPFLCKERHNVNIWSFINFDNKIEHFMCFTWFYWNTNRLKWNQKLSDSAINSCKCKFLYFKCLNKRMCTFLSF